MLCSKHISYQYVVCDSDIMEYKDFAEDIKDMARHIILGNIVRDKKTISEIVSYYLHTDKVCTLQQRHTNKVFILNSASECDHEIHADAIVTNILSIPIVVYTADCVPIFFADVQKGVIAICHAGWRGTLNGIIENTVDTMKHLGSNIHDIKVLIGPSIQQHSYEVQKDFYDTFLNESKYNNKFFKTKDNAMFFDLVGYAIHRLRSLSIQCIYDCKINTYSNFNFASFRKNKHLDLINLGIMMLVNKSQNIWANLVSSEKITRLPKYDKLEGANFRLNDASTIESTPPNNENSSQYNSPDSKMFFSLDKRIYTIDRTLDLHGHSIKDAYTTLKEFLHSAYLNREKCVLVITGKGNNAQDKHHTIREKFPHWLEYQEILQYVKNCYGALPHHGGPGAFYILMH
ncbi:MAG: smr domain protein [Candidatus Xenolissoclinum pacificiensis L6]|uniref:Purine nucleoside phosphorylase n=1 Tax=Candidatus Xenolissoclinum pacificiensis L6 TaxID=1401685 RepID=W2UZ44_9RICK|nr:MAG: smr domain protein [Candidatus Xenolissoclinum pacificiensis L6]